MSNLEVPVRVECEAGPAGDQTPVRFFLGERVIEASRILDRWLGPDHSYFKIVGSDGATYILRHDLGSAQWELVMFERALGSRQS